VNTVMVSVITFWDKLPKRISEKRSGKCR